MLEYSGIKHKSKNITGDMMELMKHPDYEYGLPVVTLNDKRMGMYKAAFKNLGMRLGYLDTNATPEAQHKTQ